MDVVTCGLINGPFMILNVLANVFFIFCMVCPLHGERIKQPLKLLLSSLVYCTTSYLMSAVVLFFSNPNPADSFALRLASYAVLFCSLSPSMNSSVWLNFFYYTQIVPAQRALFIWIKKNIKPIIFCIWIVDQFYCFFSVSVLLVNQFTLNDLISDGFSYNFTMYNDTVYDGMVYLLMPSELRAIAMWIEKSHIIFCVCVMVVSSGSTVVYLCRHMHRMASNGQPLSCPRFRSKVRVTVTGILQGALYVFCAVWILCKPFSMYDPYSTFTVINFYMVGTTFNLGAGQAVFRQRAADISVRAAQWCKVSKVQQAEQRG